MGRNLPSCIGYWLCMATAAFVYVAFSVYMIVFETYVAPAPRPGIQVDERKIMIITNGTKGWHIYQESEFDMTHCPQLTPEMKCEWRFSRGQSYLTNGDAVIFRPFAIHHGYRPPEHHPPNQKWVFQEHESPIRTWNKQRNGMGMWKSFNISISFVPEADIVHSSDAFQCSIDPHFKPSLPPDFDYIKNKTGTVLWIVSNCHSRSGREGYVKEMKKHIAVDVYGKCGKGIICRGYSAYRGHNCTGAFIGRYKFYLAFENSLCNHYYTEKLTKTIGVDTIPVVMGLVNYSSILTPGTFIDVRDFSSVKALTDHLNYLDQNDTAFNEIIKRKRSVNCVKSYTRPYFCMLCHYLHVNKYRTQITADPRVWWSTGRQCQNKNAFFKGIR